MTPVVEQFARLVALLKPAGKNPRVRFPTRAEAVRSAIESLVDQERRHRVGAEIAEGYRRIPQSDEGLAAAAAAAARSIHDEPWD